MLNTKPAILRVLREQNLREQNAAPPRLLDLLEAHVQMTASVESSRYERPVAQGHLDRIKEETVGRVLEAFDAVPGEVERWRQEQAAKLAAEPAASSYELSPMDALILRDGAPSELEDLIARAGEDPVVRRAVELRLVELCKQTPHRLTSEPFASLCRVRRFGARPRDRGARLRDLDVAAARRLQQRRTAILDAAAALADISVIDVQRAAAARAAAPPK